MSDVRLLEIGPDEHGSRLDRWIARRFPGIPFGRLQRLVRTGQIRVDGKRATGGRRVQAGEWIRIPPLPEAAEGSAPPERTAGEREAARLRSMMLYEDEDVIALAKPPGLAVQGGSGTTTHVDAMLDAIRDPTGRRPRLVHRLDKDTSGVLLLGRGMRATERLMDSFRSRDARKLYWAIVVGRPGRARGVVDVPLVKLRGSRERMVALAPRYAAEGKKATTLYRIVATANGKATWVAFQPLTGRTHQLRVHAVKLGCPILGDGKYGGRGAFLPGADVPRRLHLHARRIALPHPRGGLLDVTAPLPDGLASSWRALGFDPELAGTDAFVDGDGMKV